MKQEIGCVNKNCSKCKEHFHYKPDVKFCTECGSELVSVCKSCHKKIEQGDALLCVACKTKRSDTRNKIVTAALGAVALVVMTVGTSASKELLKHDFTDD